MRRVSELNTWWNATWCGIFILPPPQNLTCGEFITTSIKVGRLRDKKYYGFSLATSVLIILPMAIIVIILYILYTSIIIITLYLWWKKRTRVSSAAAVIAFWNWRITRWDSGVCSCGGEMRLDTTSGLRRHSKLRPDHASYGRVKNGKTKIINDVK